MGMTLLDVLKLIEKDYFPMTVCKNGTFDTRPQSVFEVTICFMCEEETWLTCNIQNEILVPWYDCEVSSIHPNSDNKNSICVWLHDKEYIKKNYPQHLWEEVEDGMTNKDKEFKDKEFIDKLTKNIPTWKLVLIDKWTDFKVWFWLKTHKGVEDGNE